LSTIAIPEPPLALRASPETKIEPTASGIRELRGSLARWLSIPAEDQDLIDFCLAVYKSHEIAGDPLWGIIIDASGAGKTELLRALRSQSNAYFLSNLTEKTLVSGYRDPKHPQKDLSLLPELNEKVLIIKDLAPLLGMRADSRSAIIASLRDAYDGFTDQGRGNLGRISYESRFTLLAASTLAIERTDTVEQELGERFIKFRARGDGDKEKVRRAISNIGADASMRQDIGKAISEFLNRLPVVNGGIIPFSFREALADLSDFAAKARSHVPRDRSGTIEYKPRPEVGTRLGKELGKLLLALAAVRGKLEPDQSDFETVIRVAEDCLPPNRIAVLNVLRARRTLVRPSEIERATDLPHATVAKALDDLRVLGAVESASQREEITGSWRLVSDWKSTP
jgi:hypothetical protein